MTRRRDAVVRRGLRHVGRAIREQRGMFTLAVLGSSLYGGMTVASAYVIGEITDRVLLPSFETGATTAGALGLAAVAIIGVAVFKILGILGRRLFAGIMSYRLQADYRRRVTRQYLRLPLSWHQRHPTGQLSPTPIPATTLAFHQELTLSNAPTARMPTHRQGR